MPENSEKTTASFGLHDGAGPCGTEMTLADGTIYKCTHMCGLPLDDNGTHTGPHLCDMYNHPF